MQRSRVLVLIGLLAMPACLDRKSKVLDGAVAQDAPQTEVTVLVDAQPGIDAQPAVDYGARVDQGPSVDQATVVDGPATADVPITGVDVPSAEVPQGTGGILGSGGRIVGTGGAGGLDGGGGSGTGGAVPLDAPALLPNGSTCTTGTVCTSGMCADGVCCNNTCAGCNACTRAATGQADGLCAPVSAGLDPHTTCTDETATNQCGNDGTCDGNGACRKVGTSHLCAAASCVGSTFTPASYCTGNGACATVTPQSCGAFQCSVTEGCKTTCTTQADCGSQSYCNTGTGSCLPKIATGGACTQSLACVSGSCVDGVCCENTCTGTCKACSAAKTGASDGLCRPIKVGTDPDNECTTDASNPCGLDGMCDGVGACRYQVSGTTCGTSSCSNGVRTPAGQCNGNGTCISATTSSQCPGGLPCADAVSCATSCTDRSTTGCAAGYKCVGGNSCIAATVNCGGTGCQVGNGGFCCVQDPDRTNTNAVFTCAAPASTLACDNSTIPQSQYRCNSNAECASGQVCCYTRGTGLCSAGYWEIKCAASCNNPMAVNFYVCDPLLVPSECASGTTCQYDSCAEVNVCK